MEAVSHPLIGRWQSEREALHPSGSYQTTLTFDAGFMSTDVRSYGVYSGTPSELSAYTTTTGAFEARGDSLFSHPERQVWWDRFYGANSPEHVVALSGGGSMYAGAQFVIEENRLTIHYLSYPADGPVPTTATFVRVP
jgi:hypothetical protein